MLIGFEVKIELPIIGIISLRCLLYGERTIRRSSLPEPMLSSATCQMQRFISYPVVISPWRAIIRRSPN